MTAIEEEERELKMAQIRADIANKMADSEYKRGLLRWEPWKVIASFVVATAAIVGVVAGIIGYRIGQVPAQPQTIVIQTPAPKG